MTIRLFERELRADSNTGSACVPSRITHASNFSLARRLALSEVIGTVSMPNCRKQSESRFLEDSFRSTSAARAENFLEGDRGKSVFPKAFSLSTTAETLFWRGNPARATAHWDNPGYKSAITR